MISGRALLIRVVLVIAASWLFQAWAGGFFGR